MSKHVTCLHCHGVIDADELIDGPPYVEHGAGKWCPNCKGPLDAKAVGLKSYAVGSAVGGGDEAKKSALERVTKWSKTAFKKEA